MQALLDSRYLGNHLLARRSNINLFRDWSRLPLGLPFAMESILLPCVAFSSTSLLHRECSQLHHLHCNLVVHISSSS